MYNKLCYVQNAATITLGAYSIISQYSNLYKATHDRRDNNFPQYSKPLKLERRSWLTARCFIGPGVTIGEGAIVGASSSVFKDVEPRTVVGENPATFIISKRELIDKNGI